MSLRSFTTRLFAPPRSWIRAVVRRNRLETEMEAELENHLEALTADLVRAGYTANEAARRARIALGSTAVAKEEMRASLGLRWWDALWADLRYGTRILAKSPSFTSVAAASLALAIGANTTISSLGFGELLRRSGRSAGVGRGITPVDDAKPGQGAVVVIGYGLWEREFGRSQHVLGEVIRVNDTPLTIVGVNPKGFTSAEDVQTPDDVFIPLSMQPLVSPQPGKVAPLFDPSLWWVNIMGRAKAGVSDAAAQATLDTQLAAVVRGTMPVRANEDLPRIYLRDGSRGRFEQRRTFAKPMSVLMTLVGFLLLLACANVAATTDTTTSI